MKHTFLRALCLLCAILLMGAMTLTGCGSEEPATDVPGANGNETPGNEAPVTEKHNHEEPAIMRLTYEEAEGGTFTLIIKDCKDNVVCEKAGLAKKAISKEIATGIVELAWVTNNNPGGYECLYINRLTCQVSDMIAGEQITDGTRIVYTEVKDGKLSVTVRDLFNKNGYSKVTEIEDAYTAGEYTVLGAVKVKDQVNVSFLTDKDGAHRIMAFDLYEKGEKTTAPSKKPTESTKK